MWMQAGTPENQVTARSGDRMNKEQRAWKVLLGHLITGSPNH
jgi:hypothetical protein